MSLLLRPFAFLLVLLSGHLLRRIGFFGENDHRLLSKIVLNLTLPAAAVQAFGGTDPNPLLLWVVLCGFLCSLLPLLLMYLSTRRLDTCRRVFYMVNISGYNLGCFSLPLVQSFFGPAGAVVVCAFDIGNAMMVSGGAYFLTSSLLPAAGGGSSGRREKPWEILKRFASSVAFDTYLIMLVLMLLHIPVPDVLLRLTEPLGQANPFLAMLMLGMMIPVRREAGYPAHAVRMLAARLLFAAAFSLLLYWAAPFPPEVRPVLAVLAFSPMSVLATVYTEKCGGDPALASFTNSISVLVSLVAMSGLSLFLLR